MYNNYNPYQYGNYNQQPLYQPNYAQNNQNIGQNSNQLTQYAQPLTQKPVISGKMVESIEIAKTIETPLDGSTIYMPLLDKSAIVSKRLTTNGTSEITIYKPIIEENKEERPITLEDVKQSLDDLKNRNNGDILDAIEELKKELKKKSDK